MLRAIVFLVASVAVHSCVALSVPRWAAPVLQLPYATYKGYHNESSGLDVFLGVRYAQSTEGENRFRVAQAPMDETDHGQVDATTFAPQCPQSSTGDNELPTEYNPLQTTDSEDCLFVNIYRPPNANGLPIFVWIHGGGWEFNSAREFDPTPMILYSNSSFIGISIQYRLGAFGNLASSNFGEGNSNFQVGDANAALLWVQQHAQAFGGDFSRVTIAGESSGGGTILQLYSAYAASGQPAPWKNAFVASPYMVAMGSCDDPRFWGRQFQDFSAAANCTDDGECLRQISTQQARILSSEFSAHKYTGYYAAYSPCIESNGGLLTHNAANQLLYGAVPNTTLIAGNNYLDGPSFTSTVLNPSNDSATLQSDADYLLREWIKDNFPVDHQVVLDGALALYQLSDFEDNNQRAGQIFNDVVFACPVNWVLEQSGSKGYRYVYAVPPGTHAADNAQEFPYFYGSRTANSPSLYASFIGPLVSLITSSNVDAGSSDITWPKWDDSRLFKVLNVSTSHGNISDSYISSNLPQAGTKERCDFWADVRNTGNW